MRSLAERVYESDLLESEIIWAAYETNPSTVLKNAVLKKLDGTPGFTLYLGIDARKLFKLDFAGNEETAEHATSPYAYTRLPSHSKAPSYDPVPFAEGMQPTWADAVSGRWPVLDSTGELRRRLEYWIRRGGGGGAVAIGPVGEGKSLAIRQVALDISNKAGIGWSCGASRARPLSLRNGFLPPSLTTGE